MIRLDMNFSKEFVDLYNKFNSTNKGKELLELSGISRDKLDVATISKQYFNESVSDISIDPNSNVGQMKNLNTFTSEVTKGLLKLDNYFLLYKYIEKLFGKEEAEDLITKCIDGQYYPHDLTKLSVPYCCAISTSNIMVYGRPYGSLRSKPPKRSTSFINQCIEHVMTSSQEFAGAVALGDLLINYAWYINKESDGLFEKENSIKSNEENVLVKFYKDENGKIRNKLYCPTHKRDVEFKDNGLDCGCSKITMDSSSIDEIKDKNLEVNKKKNEFINEVLNEVLWDNKLDTEDKKLSSENKYTKEILDRYFTYNINITSDEIEKDNIKSNLLDLEDNRIKNELNKKLNNIDEDNYEAILENDAKYCSESEINEKDNSLSLEMDKKSYGESFKNLMEKSYWDKKIENDFQSFIHVTNNNFRIGGDSLIFSNMVNVYIKNIKKLKSKDLLSILN